MTNLTVRVDDETLKRARIRALEEYAGIREGRREAGEDFLRLTEEYEASSDPGGRSWTRDELYERG